MLSGCGDKASAPEMTRETKVNTPLPQVPVTKPSPPPIPPPNNEEIDLCIATAHSILTRNGIYVRAVELSYIIKW